jgi:hypothetical protein
MSPAFRVGLGYAALQGFLAGCLRLITARKLRFHFRQPAPLHSGSRICQHSASPSLASLWRPQ